MRRAIAVSLFFATGLVAATPSAKAPPATQPKIEPPLTEAQVAQLKQAETDAQKELRAKLKDLGRIYFDSNLDGKTRVYVMNADGSDLKCLTPGDLGGGYPHLPADGRRLTYTAGTVDKLDKAAQDKLAADPNFPWAKRFKGAAVVWLADPDGANARPVAGGGCPHFSRDGARIAYMAAIAHARDQKPAILDLRTNPPTEKVLSGPFKLSAGMPAFTPDGQGLIVSNGAAQLLPLDEQGADLAAGAKPIPLVGGHPCNMEISADAQYLTWVIDTLGDAGSWLCWRRFAEAKAKPGGEQQDRMPLGWSPRSISYFPDFSPDGQYLVYSHGDMQQGVKSWLLTHHQEIYVTDFPASKTTIQLTFNNAANSQPFWVGSSNATSDVREPRAAVKKVAAR